MDFTNDPSVEDDLINLGQTLQNEEIFHEGDSVSTSNSVRETEFIRTNDHTYVLPESEPFPDANIIVPSPRTELWRDLEKEVDMKLRVEEHGDCSYSAQNSQYHIKSKSKFAITAVMTGL